MIHILKNIKKLSFFLIPCVLSTLAIDNALAKENVIKIATLDYPPFTYQDGNVKKGIVLDIVVEIFKRLDIPIEIEFYPIRRGLEMVQDGRADAYFSLKKTKEREHFLTYTMTPIVKQKFVIFTLTDSNIRYTGDINELSAYSVGIECNTSYGKKIDTAIKDGIIHRIDCAPSFENKLKKLLAHRTDIIIGSFDVGNELLKKIGKQELVKSLEPPLDEVASYLAFTRERDFTYLATEFDKKFNEMLNDGTINSIKSKYPSSVSIGY